MSKKKETSKTLVLLDAHAILHRAFHALPDFSSPKGEPTGALYGLTAMLLRLTEDLKPDYLVACYDLPEPTYRHQAFEGYKAKRKKTDSTLVEQIERSRELLAALSIPIIELAGFEADDILGTISYQLRNEPDLKIIIASGDMDTLQCVSGNRVQVYTLKRGIKETTIYNEAAVVERFGFPPKLVPDYKGLRGDPSDNIPGIVGIGDKLASLLITNFGSIEQIYKQLKKDEAAFLNSGIKPRILALLKNNEEEAIFSKMLATIRTDAPIDFVLPEKVWPEEVDSDTVLNLFNELGFRSLAGRLRDRLSGETQVTAEASPPTIFEQPDADMVEEAGIMLWLLESERTNPSYEDIIDYGRAEFAADDLDLGKIKKELEKTLKVSGLWHIYEEIEQPLREVIKTMNQTGIRLDVSYLKTLSERMHTELDKLRKDIFKQAGVEFNLNSPKQLGEILFDHLELKPARQKKTAGGQRSTKESELEKLRDDHPIIGNILRYRELQKLVSTYIDNLPKLVSSDGRLRTTFLQTGTVTGRLSSHEPNLQNIPIRTEESRAIRRAFVSESGYRLVALDYSQIELRLAAIMSDDPKLIDIFKKDEDVHSGVAARVFKVEEADVTKEMRRQAKVINFGILYGMGAVALQKNLGGDTSRAEAQEFLNTYFNTFARLAEYLNEVKDQARRLGYTETMFGRRRYFPGLRSTAPFIRAQAERMAINAPIQGTEADLVRVAMNRVHAHLKKANKLETVRMLLQVHDELVFEVREDSLDEGEQIKKIMESVMDGHDTKGVPIKVEISTGPNWADLGGQ